MCIIAQHYATDTQVIEKQADDLHDDLCEQTLMGRPDEWILRDAVSGDGEADNAAFDVCAFFS